MHQLHLLRHAKTVVGAGIDDRERRLTKRGRETARRLGGLLPASVGAIDLVLCSSAKRTCETLELVLAGFDPHPPVMVEDALYLASAAVLLRRLRRLDEACGAVLVIGHNPGLHELALTLARPDSGQYAGLEEGKFPTAARASFAVGSPWSAIERGRQQLIAYATPQSLGATD